MEKSALVVKENGPWAEWRYGRRGVAGELHLPPAAIISMILLFWICVNRRQKL